MHLRMPSIDHGVQAFAWAFVFFLVIWIGAWLLDFPTGMWLLISALIGCAVFLLVRKRGGDYPGPR